MLGLAFTSRVSLFNRPQQQIKLYTNEPTQLIVAQETLQGVSQAHHFKVKRSSEALTIKVQGDSLVKELFLVPKNSFAYLSNFIYPSLVSIMGGLIADRNSDKRFAYPTILSVDLQDAKRAYHNYNIFNKTKQLFKVTPLKLIGIQNASLELAYERPTGEDFSTMLMLSWLLPASLYSFNDDPAPETKGFRFALEERFYFKEDAPFGPYFALELDYLNKHSYARREFAPLRVVVDPYDYHEDSYEDTFIVNASYLSRNFKFGYQREFSAFFLDFYIGLGVRTRNISHSKRINLADVLLSYMHYDFNYSRLKEGHSSTLSFPLNARLGWRF